MMGGPHFDMDKNGHNSVEVSSTDRGIVVGV